MAFMRQCIRIGVIGGLAAGAVVLIAGPERVAALATQAKSGINQRLDEKISDPVALRAQLRALEAQYPQRISQVRSDLGELREQSEQLKRTLEINRRVVALADEDADKLASALERAQEAQMQAVAEGEPHRVVLVFRNHRLDPESARSRLHQIVSARNAYTAQIADIERDLGYLGKQESRLSELLARLESERAEFQAQLWQLDNEVDAIARNERMIKIMERRQASIDEQSRYRAASLDQVRGRLAERRAEQESRMAALAAGQERTNYEDLARMELDRETAAHRAYDESTRSQDRSPRRYRVIEINPDDPEQTKDEQPRSVATDKRR